MLLEAMLIMALAQAPAAPPAPVKSALVMKDGTMLPILQMKAQDLYVAAVLDREEVDVEGSTDSDLVLMNGTTVRIRKLIARPQAVVVKLNKADVDMEQSGPASRIKQPQTAVERVVIGPNPAGYAPAESTSVSTSSGSENEVVRAMKRYCADEWGSDYRMREYCFKQQAEGARECQRLIPLVNQRDPQVVKNAQKKWWMPKYGIWNFRMVAYELKRQYEAMR